MSERAAPGAARLAAVVFTATVAGGLLAAELRDTERGPARGVDGDHHPVATTVGPPLVATSGQHAPLARCVGAAAGDVAALEVCAVTVLVGLLHDDAGLDEVAASCAAEAVVDEVGVHEVVAALETGTAPAGLRANLRDAFSRCR